MKNIHSIENTKPTVKNLIEIINDKNKLDCWLKSFTKKCLKNEKFNDWEDVAIEAEQYVQNFKWNKNEVCELLKRLDHQIVANYIVDSEQNANYSELLERATIRRYAELLNYAIYSKDDEEKEAENYKMEDYFSKNEIEKRNKLCNSLKEIDHKKLAKIIINLKDKFSSKNLFENSLLEYQKSVEQKNKTLKMKCK